MWTTSPELHERLTGEPFPKSPLSGVIASQTDFGQLRGPGRPAGWSVDPSDGADIASAATDVGSVVADRVLPYLDGIRSLDDLLTIYDGRLPDYHAASVQAAIHVLRGQPDLAVQVLCQWRNVYTSGTPESQLEDRESVSEFAEKLGLVLPVDEFTPVTVQQQLCARLLEECDDLSRGHVGKYNHAENLYKEIMSHGPVPATVDARYRQARSIAWANMSCRQLCRMAKKFCDSAARLPRSQSRQLYQDAHQIFLVVSNREAIPEVYRDIAKTAADNGG